MPLLAPDLQDHKLEFDSADRYCYLCCRIPFVTVHVAGAQIKYGRMIGVEFAPSRKGAVHWRPHNQERANLHLFSGAATSSSFATTSRCPLDFDLEIASWSHLAGQAKHHVRLIAIRDALEPFKDW